MFHSLRTILKLRGHIVGEAHQGVALSDQEAAFPETFSVKELIL
jgi:hypothetical protein